LNNPHRILKRITDELEVNSLLSLSSAVTLNKKIEKKNSAKFVSADSRQADLVERLNGKAVRLIREKSYLAAIDALKEGLEKAPGSALLRANVGEDARVAGKLRIIDIVRSRMV
jgi:hypothetical protein